jgi:hypothetical protein
MNIKIVSPNALWHLFYEPLNLHTRNDSIIPTLRRRSFIFTFISTCLLAHTPFWFSRLPFYYLLFLYTHSSWTWTFALWAHWGEGCGKITQRSLKGFWHHHAS